MQCPHQAWPAASRSRATPPWLQSARTPFRQPGEAVESGRPLRTSESRCRDIQNPFVYKGFFDRYFEDEEEEQTPTLAYIPAPGSPTQVDQGGDEEQDDDGDDDEDPLDAYMAGLQKQIKTKEVAPKPAGIYLWFYNRLIADTCMVAILY